MKNTKMRKLIFLMMFVGSFYLMIEPVFAINCDAILTAEAADFIAKIFSVLRIMVPILLIVLGGVDFGSAVISDDKDGLKKAGTKFLKRCICGVAIFFIPLVVSVLLDITGIKGTIVDDPMCSTLKDVV